MIHFKVEIGDKPKVDGTHAIYIRLTQNRKLKRVSVGLSVDPRNFNTKGSLDKRNWIRSTHRESGILNQIISEKLVEAQVVASELKADATLDTVVSRLKKVGNGELANSFIQYAEGYVEHFNDDYNTYRGKKSSLNKFKDFLNGENPNERQKSRSVAPTAKDKKCRDLLFSEINLPLIREFEKYLKALGNKTNTVDKELSRLRAIITSAVRDDRMPLEQNPFLKFRLRRERTDKVRLVEAEIDALALLELPTGSLLRDVRNAYLFSYYCAGIRCGDLLNLRWTNVADDILTYTMNKTSRSIRVKIKTNAQAILDEYRSSATKPTDYIFPFLDNNAPQSDDRSSALAVGNKNPVLNKMLKVLAEKAGINKLVTMHTARHSFADLCRRKTNDLYATSKLLGHSSLRITENYLAHFDPKSVDNTMDSIFE